MKINPFFFHKITAQLLIFLRLFDGMVHPSGSRKEKCREKAGFLVGNPADSRHCHHVFTALSRCFHILFYTFVDDIQPSHSIIFIIRSAQPSYPNTEVFRQAS